jgi:hypothetical protein
MEPRWSPDEVDWTLEKGEHDESSVVAGTRPGGGRERIEPIERV